MRNFISLSFLVVLLASCYEKQEGCLDFRAEDYDFSADIECEDCCTYPDLKLGVTHYWGDTTLMTDSVYTNSVDQSIKILNAQFYLTEVVLLDDGEETTVPETLEVVDSSGTSEEISAAFAFVRNTRFTYILGTFEEAQVYDGISFKFGVDGNYIDEELVEDVLFFDDETYEYVNFRMEYITDQVTLDTLTFELEGVDFVSEIELSGTIDIPLGEEHTIDIIADYDLLFDDIDIENLNSDTEKASVLANFQQFFRFE